MLTGSELFMLVWLKDQARVLEDWLRERPAPSTQRRLEHHRAWLTAEIHRLENKAA